MKSRREILMAGRRCILQRVTLELACVPLALLVFVMASPARATSLLARPPADTHACGHSQVDEPLIPEQVLQRRIAILKGLGELHRKVTTSSPAAQAYYDQGRAFLFSYDWIQAARSFHEALRQDPRLAMAYLGLSYAFSGVGETDRAAAMAEKASILAGNVTPPERLFIALRKTHLQAIRSNAAEDLKQYVEALDAALKENPKDADLLLLRGNAAEGFAGAIGQRGTRESISFYRKVLEIDPNNAAAHHFLIHANEMVNDLPEAVKHGQRYAELAPAVPHAQHMYGHDLRRIGRLQEAIAQFQKSRVLAEEFYTGNATGLQYDWNYRHNLSLLAGTYHQAGEWKLAEKTARELTVLPVNNGGDDYYRKDLPALLLELGRYHDALSATKPLISSRFQIGRMLGHAIAGLAYIGLKQPQQAATELAAVQRGNADVKEGWRYAISPWADSLQNLIELQSSNHQSVVDRAAQQERNMRSRPGADAWSDALFHLELIEHLAAELGAWNLADLTAKQMQEHAPDYGGTHLALAEIARHKGDESAAQHELKLAMKAWPTISSADLH